MTSGTAPKEQDPEAAEGLPVAAREASRVTPSAWRFARCQTILLATLVAFSIVLYVYKLGRDSPQCHPAPPARYSDTCPMRGYGWLLPGTSLLLSPVWSDEKRWGNELSVYWNGRGMARLGGLSFAAVGDFHHAWLRYLPLYVPARDPPASCAAFEEACDSCEDWKYSHKCVGAWTHISDEIVADTRAALRKYAGLHGRVIPEFGPEDIVIHNRCAGDVWFWHSEYGPSCFSLYKGFPQNMTGTIYIVGTASQERHKHARAAYTGAGIYPPCARKLQAMNETLQRWYPQAKVVVGAGWDVFDDFVHMVFAPTLIKDSSTFGLWAGMSNSGTIISNALLPAGKGAQYFYHPRWQWRNVTVLYPDVAEKLGLNVSNTEEVIRYLEQH